MMNWWPIRRNLFQTVIGLLCVTFACLAYADEEPSAPAQYEFSYAVNEPSTGDQKDQQETRNGDDVNGYYRTLDPDGYLRTVKYKSDAVSGFTAEVTREPVNGAVPTVAKAVPKPAPVPVISPAPVIVKAPVAPIAAPVAPVVPAPYYVGAPSYPYNYGYQPYSYNYGYQPYSYGYQPYPYSYQPYPYGQYAPPALRK